MRPVCAILCRRFRVKAKQHQQVLPKSIRPPTIGSAMAMASLPPWMPEPDDFLLDGAEGPDINVSLNMEAPSGKNGLPGTGG